MPHPATMFFLLTLAVIFLSWIFDVYGLSVLQPETREEIRVQSLLSPEGIRWLLRHVVTNFTGFAPLGLVIVVMFGIGVAQHSGFIDACIRRGTGIHGGLSFGSFYWDYCLMWWEMLDISFFCLLLLLCFIRQGCILLVAL